MARSISGKVRTIAVVAGISVLAALSSQAEEDPAAQSERSNGAVSEREWWDELIPPTSMTGNLGRVDLHGFGSWAYADTDGNPYLGGTASSSFDNVDGGLVIIASAFERLRIQTQISAESSSGNSNLTLERAFAEWTFTDWLKLRGGRTPHPIGIYSEVLDIGTTRPFFDLPQGVYGPVGVTGESYDGAGVTGTFVLGDWEISYDAYGGSNNIEFSTPYAVVLTGPVPNPGSVFDAQDRHLAGGRIRIATPIDGLEVGVSAYRSEINRSAGTTAERVVVGGQFEFARENYSLRGEYYRSETDEFESNSDNAYAMATLRPFAFFDIGNVNTLLDRLEVAGLWTISDVRAFILPAAKQTKKHREWAVGLNYWFTPSFVARAEYHVANDNLFAHDGAVLLSKLATGDLDNETQLVKVGLQFSF